LILNKKYENNILWPCILGIAVGGKYLLVDPLFLLIQKRHIDLETLKADYILFLTHAHGDHILDVEAIAKEPTR
jgi:glyoxylase-like metal-dependent hydrolase (beta-lactamase superfamily II)